MKLVKLFWLVVKRRLYLKKYEKSGDFQLLVKYDAAEDKMNEIYNTLF